MIISVLTSYDSITGNEIIRVRKFSMIWVQKYFEEAVMFLFAKMGRDEELVNGGLECAHSIIVVFVQYLHPVMVEVTREFEHYITEITGNSIRLSPIPKTVDARDAIEEQVRAFCYVVL